MLSVAFKMLIGNRAAFIGIIFGVFLATLLISQQSAIFFGLLSRSYRTLTDIPTPDIWVMDPTTESDDKARGMPDQYLQAVRSVPQVAWAAPIGVVMANLITDSGIFKLAKLYGIDDVTLVGAPTEMVAGNIRDLRREDGIIIDIYSATETLARESEDGKKHPLQLGDEVEINNRRAVIVGICKITRGFYPEPVIFTTYSQFLRYDPAMRNHMTLIAAKSTHGAEISEVAHRITERTGLKALSKQEFEDSIVSFFLKTGILINFALSVSLGIIIGVSIAGQIFYMMTLHNLPYYALIKAIGGTSDMISKMITLQAIIVGFIGFVIGIAATLLWGLAVKDTTLAYLFTWQLLLFTGFVIILICVATAQLSIRKVRKLDPIMLMGN